MSLSVFIDAASMKMALIIGNWAYQNMAGLEMVRADVKTLSDLLYGMNFDVVTLCNLSKSEIRAAVQQLCDLLLDKYDVISFPCFSRILTMCFFYSVPTLWFISPAMEFSTSGTMSCQLMFRLTKTTR